MNTDDQLTTTDKAICLVLLGVIVWGLVTYGSK